ncbi:hypothetical protein GCM10009801_80370 [Streptomyces albiaxialis]|uniref:HTH araC/xylS-type domain-containing protein n=1 Tax=Streptomyces albiaxialis TaxID=329523 RepID=A0ABP5ISX5_9ACTN
MRGLLEARERGQEEDGWLRRLDRYPEVGTLAYGTVPANWRVSFDRGIPDHLLHLVVAGRYEGVAGRQRIRVGPGTLMWLKPGETFTLRAADSRPLTLYRLQLPPAPAEDPPLGPVVVLPGAWELRAPLDLLISEREAEQPFREVRTRAALELLFSSTLRIAEHQRTVRPALDPSQRRLLEDHADARVAERVHPAELARLLRFSPEHFTRCFRRTYGCPPKVWLVRRRIQYAARLLDETQDTITYIARSLGYCDVYLFSRQFKSVTGLSPRAYRAR